MGRFRPLDRIDVEILEALQKNARMPNKQLAAELGIAPSTCLERVRRLARDGIFRGFHADLDPRALGIRLQAMISVRLVRHSRRQVEAFEQHALALPQVVAVHHVAGANDYLVHVAVRDSDDLRELVLEQFITRPEVEHIETSLMFGFHYKWQLPIYNVEE